MGCLLSSNGGDARRIPLGVTPESVSSAAAVTSASAVTSAAADANASRLSCDDSPFVFVRWLQIPRVSLHRSVDASHMYVCRRHRYVRRANDERRILTKLGKNRYTPHYVHVPSKKCVYMRFESGMDLYRVITTRPDMQIWETLSLLQQVLDALVFCHDRGVAHLDVKPENVIVTDDGRVRLIDFEFASLVPSSCALVRLSTRGTVGYMSPEVYVDGMGGCASDVWGYASVVAICLLRCDVVRPRAYLQLLTKDPEHIGRLAIDKLSGCYNDSSVDMQAFLEQMELMFARDPFARPMMRMLQPHWPTTKNKAS